MSCRSMFFTAIVLGIFLDCCPSFALGSVTASNQVTILQIEKRDQQLVYRLDQHVVVKDLLSAIEDVVSTKGRGVSLIVLFHEDVPFAAVRDALSVSRKAGIAASQCRVFCFSNDRKIAVELSIGKAFSYDAVLNGRPEILRDPAADIGAESKKTDR